MDLFICFQLVLKEVKMCVKILGQCAYGRDQPCWAAALWRTVLVSKVRAVGEKRVPGSSDLPSFLPDSVGGFSLPPKASGSGAACPSCPLVLLEQHDWEWHPAWAGWERPNGGMPAIQEPPEANGLPPAGLCRQPAKASSQNAPGTLRHRVPG